MEALTDSMYKTNGCVVNCREEKCDNREAYFRQVQIRSADEPMTTFYKVFLLDRAASEMKSN